MKLTPIAEMSTAEREACIQAFLRDDADVAKRVDAAELLECVADAWSDKADMHNKAVAVAAERMVTAIDAATQHDLPDWMYHRLSVLRAEASGLVREMQNHKEER